MFEIFSKYWNALQINLKLLKTFKNNPFVAFKRNKNLQETIGSYTIKNRKVFKIFLENRKGKCEP